MKENFQVVCVCVGRGRLGIELRPHTSTHVRQTFNHWALFLGHFFEANINLILRSEKDIPKRRKLESMFSYEKDTK